MFAQRYVKARFLHNFFHTRFGDDFVVTMVVAAGGAKSCVLGNVDRETRVVDKTVVFRERNTRALHHKREKGEYNSVKTCIHTRKGQPRIPINTKESAKRTPCINIIRPYTHAHAV